MNTSGLLRWFLCICICSTVAIVLYWQRINQSINPRTASSYKIDAITHVTDHPWISINSRGYKLDWKTLAEALATDTNGTCSIINTALRNYYNTSDAGREPLQNAYLNMFGNNSVDASEFHNANIIFVHLPKSGGTSVEQVLFKLKPDVGKIRKVELAHCGHMLKEAIMSKNNPAQTVHYSKRSYGFHDYVYSNRSVAYVTWFREPISRLLSSYYYLKKTHCGSNHVVCKKYLMNSPSLTHYLKRTEHVHLQDMSNYMVRLLQFGDFPEIDDTFEDCCGSVTLSDASKIPIIEEKHYLVAKRNLETKMAFIGLTEDFETSQKMLTHMFGIPQQRRAVHVNANRHRSHIAGYELAQLSERNKWDLKLYEDAKKIYEEQKRNYVKASQLCKKHRKCVFGMNYSNIVI